MTLKDNSGDNLLLHFLSSWDSLNISLRPLFCSYRAFFSSPLVVLSVEINLLCDITDLKAETPRLSFHLQGHVMLNRSP